MQYNILKCTHVYATLSLGNHFDVICIALQNLGCNQNRNILCKCVLV